MRYYLFRRSLKRVARRQPAHADLIKKTLDNEDMCAEVCAFAEEKYAESAAGKWQDFMQWVLDNQDSIVAFIKSIIDLFMAPAKKPAGKKGVAALPLLAAVCAIVLCVSAAIAQTAPSQLASPTAPSELANVAVCVCGVVDGVCKCKAGECLDPLCDSNKLALVWSKNKARLTIPNAVAPAKPVQRYVTRCGPNGCVRVPVANTPQRYTTQCGPNGCQRVSASGQQPANHQRGRPTGPVRGFFQRIFRR